MSRSSEITDPEQKLERALAALAEREEAYEKACYEFADAESEYRTQFAREFLLADGAVELKKQTAINKVAKHLKERDKKEAIRDFTKEKVKDAQLAVSARQSLLSSARRTNEAL